MTGAVSVLFLVVLFTVACQNENDESPKLESENTDGETKDNETVTREDGEESSDMGSSETVEEPIEIRPLKRESQLSGGRAVLTLEPYLLPESEMSEVDGLYQMTLKMDKLEYRKNYVVQLMDAAHNQ